MNITVIFFLSGSDDLSRSPVDDKVPQIREIEGVVISIETIASRPEGRDLKIILISDRIAGGGRVVASQADDAHGVNGLAIWKGRIAIKISHAKGGVVVGENESITISLLLLGRGHCDGSWLHEKIATRESDVVVTLQEAVARSGSSRDRALDDNLVRVERRICAGGTVNPCCRADSDSGYFLSIRKSVIKSIALIHDCKGSIVEG